MKNNYHYALILKSLLNIVRIISDAEYQNRAWIQRLEYLGDFDEIMCHFFDDCNAKEIVNHPKDYSITQKQHAKLLELYNALRIYSDNTPGALEIEVVQDPEWHKIQKLAQDTLDAFNYDKIAKP